MKRWRSSRGMVAVPLTIAHLASLAAVAIGGFLLRRRRPGTVVGSEPVVRHGY
jgi:hypothetical protein